MKEKQFGQYMVKENEVESVPEAVEDTININHYYDMPLDYTYQDEKGQHYLANFIAWNEEEKEEVFIILPVTKEEAENYNGERVSMWKVIKKLELGSDIWLAVYTGTKEKQTYYQYTLDLYGKEYIDKLVFIYIMGKNKRLNLNLLL